MKSLKYVNFRDNFINMVKMMYYNKQSLIIELQVIISDYNYNKHNTNNNNNYLY